MTGRRRFNCISNEQELLFGEQHYRQLMRQFKGLLLPDSHPDVRLVRRVLTRLLTPEMLKGQEGLDKTDWKVHIIQDDRTQNAFVLPGYGNFPLFFIWGS